MRILHACGTAALALLIGRRFYELLSPNATPTPLVALVLGLTLLTAAQLVPVVGVLANNPKVTAGAMGPGAELFRGYQDNADFGKNLHRLLRAP